MLWVLAKAFGVPQRRFTGQHEYVGGEYKRSCAPMRATTSLRSTCSFPFALKVCFSSGSASPSSQPCSLYLHIIVGICTLQYTELQRNAITSHSSTDLRAMQAGTNSASHHHREEAMGDRLQCLPAEIRNEIFHLALVRDVPVEVTQHWPGITGTCKQFRDETLAIYFGNNSFTARITDLEDTPLITWLEKVEGIHPQYKSLITSLTIFTENKLVHASISASYEYYDNIIVHIRQAGLGASQIVWPSTLLAGIAANTWTHRAPTTYPFPTQIALDDTLLHDNILPPLLNRHGLRSSANPPVNVLREMIGIYGNGVAASMSRARSKGWASAAVRQSPQELDEGQAVVGEASPR